MALVSGLSVKSGKCSNFGNCSLADARNTVEVPAGLDFVCTECGKPLLLSDAGTSGGSSRALIMGALLLAALLAAAGIAWSLFAGKKKTEVPVVSVPQVVSPLPAAKPEVKPEVKPEAVSPSPPPSGNCSEADAKAGLCRTKL